MHFDYHLKIPYILKQEITELYMAHSLKIFAGSLISLYIPIFLLKNGFSLLHVGAYTLFIYMFIMLVTPIALKYASQKGVKHSMVVSFPILILYFICLFKTNVLYERLGAFLFLGLISMLSAVSSTFYYMGFHIDFSKFSSAKKNIKQLGTINILTTLVSALGPLFGAFIISKFSYGMLIIAVISILVMAITPLFFSGEVHEPVEFNFKKMFSHFDRFDSIAFLAEGMRDMAARIFWPVLLYLLAINLKNIGGLFSATNLLIVGFTIVISKIATEEKKAKMFKLGAFIHSLSLFLRVFLKTISTIFVAQGIGAMSWTMFSLPYKSYFYGKTKKNGIVYTIFHREFFLNLGRILCISTFLCLMVFFSEITSLVTIISIASIVMLCMLFIAKD